MNHRTPAEDFRATLARMSRPQLMEAMIYLRGWNLAAVDRALAFAAIDVGGGRPHRSHGEEMPCLSQDSETGLICLAQRGHAGPVHIAYGKDDETVGTWPVAPGGGTQDDLYAAVAALAMPDDDGFAREVAHVALDGTS